MTTEKTDSKPATDAKPAADEGKALQKLQAELASTKADLAAAREGLAKLEGELKAKDDHIDTLKSVLEHLKSQPVSGGVTMLQNADEAREAARAAARHQKLHDMREQAMEIAGPKAQHVKYIVGPSGTVREGLGVVKPGKVISVPIDELPAGEWKVWTPDVEGLPEPIAVDTAAAIQRRDGRPSAAEKALAQREALAQQRGSGREV